MNYNIIAFLFAFISAVTAPVSSYADEVTPTAVQYNYIYRPDTMAEGCHISLRALLHPSPEAIDLEYGIIASNDRNIIGFIFTLSVHEMIYRNNSTVGSNRIPIDRAFVYNNNLSTEGRLTTNIRSNGEISAITRDEDTQVKMWELFGSRSSPLNVTFRRSGSNQTRTYRINQFPSPSERNAFVQCVNRLSNTRR